MTELRDRFGGSDHRSQLLNLLEDFLSELRSNGLNYPVCVDGSFVTDKDHPDDIDCVVILTGESDATVLIKHLSYISTNHDRFKRDYRVDCYPSFTGQGNDLVSFFQYVGNKTALAKGLHAKDTKGVVWLQ